MKKKLKNLKNRSTHGKRFSWLASGALIGFVIACLSVTAFATLAGKTIQVYTGVNIYVDDVKLNPTDASGNAVEAFIYNGTTYLPVRAVSEALGAAVQWDGTTSSVYIGQHAGSVTYLLDVCPPYETYSYSTPAYMTMSGTNYTNGFQCSGVTGYAYFNLNGKYDTIEFDLGHIDGGYMQDGTLLIYLDGKVAYTIDLSCDSLAQHISIDLKGALQMKMEFSSDAALNYNTGKLIDYGLANITVS